MEPWCNRLGVHLPGAIMVGDQKSTTSGATRLRCHTNCCARSSFSTGEDNEGKYIYIYINMVIQLYT